MEKRTITNILYVAFDGKQFDNERECLFYEYKHKLYDFLNSKNIKCFEDLEGEPFPADNSYDTENWNFYYFKILNENGLKEFHEFVKFLPTELDSCQCPTPKVGQIICILEPYYDQDFETDYITKIISLGTITDDIKYFYTNLGLKMTVEETKWK